MDFDKLHSVFFLGIGGIGMSGLARYFNSMGITISGYDKTCTPLTKQLESEGMSLHYEDKKELIPENIDLVIYTPAIPETNINYQYLKNKGVLFKKRSEVLGMLTDDRFTVAVAGTHGKTSITSLIAHILRTAGLNLNAFIGGISKNYNSNVIISKQLSLANQTQEIIVAEADEYDKSFLTLHPDIAIITAMDADHLDIYKTKENLELNFKQFTNQIKAEGKLILNYKLKAKISDDSISIIYYGLYDKTDAYADNVRVENNKHVFDINYKKHHIKDIHYNIPGRHNIENAVAASVVGAELGVKDEKIKESLESYKGVVRRFDYRVNTKDVVYIDDYAHHPEELKACILAVKELYQGKKVTGIFQPHLYSRTKNMADDFAEALELLDELFLLDIYPARELPIEGVSSAIIFDKVKLKNKTLCSMNNVLEKLKKIETDVLLTLGAGDIDTLVEPISKQLTMDNG